MLRALLVTWLGWMGCSSGRVLEWRDTFGAKVIDGTADATPKITISGLSGHSGLSVEHIEAHSKGATVDLLVHLVPARAGLSGSFSYELPVPATVNEVRFGTQRALIWLRGASVPPS